MLINTVGFFLINDICKMNGTHCKCSPAASRSGQGEPGIELPSMQSVESVLHLLSHRRGLIVGNNDVPESTDD